MLPLSENRLHANRANAQRSTGPVTPEGKARASQNATRHGLLAKQILVGNESPTNFDALIDLLTAQFAPVNPFEFNMIEELAASYWRLRRAWSMETEMLDSASQDKSGSGITRLTEGFRELARGPELPLLHRYEARLHLMYQRTVRNFLVLRQLQPGGVAVPGCPPAEVAAPENCELPNEPKTPSLCNESLPSPSPETTPAPIPPDVPGEPTGSNTPQPGHAIVVITQGPLLNQNRDLPAPSIFTSEALKR